MTSLDKSERAPASMARWLGIAALGVATVYGANALAFLCDDAFIHFRYAANAHDGLGIVWNPPPFERVEGAGCLWVLVLWAMWSWFGMAPPEAANPFSLVCGLVQLLLLAGAVHRLTDRDGRRLPVGIGLLALAAIVGNRTFLQWLSSGLDTALCSMWLLWWALHAFRDPSARGTKWLAIWSLAAALAAMTRPDGLPLVAATAAVGVLPLLRGTARLGATLRGLSPLLLVVGLTLWRRAYYGEWLPNTYYAKVVAAWPEAGARYFACFALENGAWLWFPIAAVWLCVVLRRPLRALVTAVLDHAPAIAATGTVMFNACYYLFVVGGDHFEYRVLSQLVPLGTVACVAMAARIGRGALLPAATAVALGLASTVGWFHLAVTSDPAHFGIKAVTPATPTVLQPIARWFDRQQLWLFSRYIGLRCVHHEFLLRVYQANHPPRGRIATAAEPFPAIATGAVGVPGYHLADCVIVDEFGLNDRVIARTPSTIRPGLAEGVMQRAVQGADADEDGFLDLAELRRAYATAFGTNPEERTADFVLHFALESHAAAKPGALSLADAVRIGEVLDAPRRMAHERLPPPGYVEAFDPNVTVAGGVVTVRPRAVPLTAERIRAIEAEWWEKVRTGQLPRREPK